MTAVAPPVLEFARSSVMAAALALPKERPRKVRRRKATLRSFVQFACKQIS
jgi:hypothetical protein